MSGIAGRLRCPPAMQGKRVRLHFGGGGLPGLGLGQRAGRRARTSAATWRSPSTSPGCCAPDQTKWWCARFDRDRQRPPAHRQANAYRERGLRLHPHHRHLAAGVAGGRRLVVRGEASPSCPIPTTPGCSSRRRSTARTPDLTLTAEAFADGKSVGRDCRTGCAGATTGWCSTFERKTALGTRARRSSTT